MCNSLIFFPFHLAWAVLLMLALLASQVNAAILFEDSFDAESEALNEIMLDAWHVTNNVDVLGPAISAFDFYSGNGRYLDLAGNRNGSIETKDSFALLPATTYTLSFELGNNNSTDNELLVEVGSVFSEVFTFSQSGFPPLELIQRQFSVLTPTTVTLAFSEQGRNDGNGAVLDDVQLSGQPVELPIVAEVPEPSSAVVWLLVGTFAASCCYARAMIRKLTIVSPFSNQ